MSEPVQPDDLHHNGKSLENSTNNNENTENRNISIEKALVLTEFGTFNYILIFISGIILTAVFLETVGISYILTISQCDLNLTNERKGIFSGAGFAGIIASSHLWGYLSDTIGRRKIIIPTLFISVGCSTISSLVNNFTTIAILRFFTGFFVSGSSATIFAYLSEFHCEKYRAQAIMFASVIFGIDCLTLPLMASFILNLEFLFTIPIINIVYKPWRLFLLVCSLQSLLAALVLIALPESPKFTLSQGKQMKTINIINSVHKINTRNKKNILEIFRIDEEIETIEHRRLNEMNNKSRFVLLKSIWLQTKPLFMPPYLTSMLIACTLQFGVYMTDGIYMWFPEVVNKIVGYSEAHPMDRLTICQNVYAAQMNHTNITSISDESNINLDDCNEKLEISTFKYGLILEIIYASGYGLIGLIIKYVGKFYILFFFFIVCGISGIASVHVQLPLLGIILCVLIIIVGIISSVISAVTVDLFPTNLRGMAVCISLMLGRCGSIIGSYVFGIYIDQYCDSLFIYSGVLLIFCGFLSFFIPNIFKKQKIISTDSELTSIN